MPEADPEYRHPAEDPLDTRDLLLQRLRIAGAVREEDAVVLHENLGVDVRWVHADGCSRLLEPAQDRALAAVVENGDIGYAGIAVDVGVQGRDGARESPPRHPRLLADS